MPLLTQSGPVPHLSFYLPRLWDQWDSKCNPNQTMRSINIKCISSAWSTQNLSFPILAIFQDFKGQSERGIPMIIPVNRVRSISDSRRFTQREENNDYTLTLNRTQNPCLEYLNLNPLWPSYNLYLSPVIPFLENSCSKH